MLRSALLLLFCFIANVICSASADYPELVNAPSALSVTSVQACKVKSVSKYPATFENVAVSPASDLLAVTQQDAKGVYQLYTTKLGSSDLKCLSCSTAAGLPRVDRSKLMVTWHPSGNWLIVGVEQDTHDNMWMPDAWKRGLLQSGIWLNIWITTPTGDKWYQITHFSKPGNGPSDGFVGTAFTPDGKHAVWAEVVDGNVLVNHFGLWKLYMADFSVGVDGTPAFLNKKDITPAGARWVEPGNFAPDGRNLLLSTDIGLSDAQGQDQWALDTTTGQLRNLTNSPAVWDEHGFYSGDGSKVAFMSSYPYRSWPASYTAMFLRTEFMLMSADGSSLQQLTHFNTAGYPETQTTSTIAAVATFIGDGSQLFATVMAPDYSFTKTNWIITFAGRCGSQSSQ